MSLLDMIPTEPLPANDKSPASMILIGGPKIGKTTCVSKLTDTLLLCCDPGGAEYVSGYKVDITSEAARKGIPRYNLLRDLCVELSQQNPRRFKRVVIDKLDNVENWAAGEATAYYKSTVVGKNFQGRDVRELEKGGGFGYFWDSFQRIWSIICGAAPQTLFLAALKETELDRQGAQADFVRKDMDLTGKIRNIAAGYADIIGLMSRTENDANLVTFRTRDKGVLSGSRVAHLEGKVFKLSQKGKDGVVRVNWNDIYPDEPKVDLEKEGA